MIRPDPTLPHAQPHATVAQITAVKALFAGQASEPQQKAALSWIVHHASRMDDLCFRPGANCAEATIFVDGRRFVGLQIKRLIEMTADKVEALAAQEAKERNGAG